MREFTVVVVSSSRLVPAKKCTKKCYARAELLFYLTFWRFQLPLLVKDLCFKAKIHRGRTLYQFILEVSGNIRRYCRFNSAASMQAATILVVVVFQMQHDGKTWPTFICLIQKLPRKIKLFPHVNLPKWTGVTGNLSLNLLLIREDVLSLFHTHPDTVKLETSRFTVSADT